MKSNLKSKIGGAILAFSILFGIGVATSVTTQAQDYRYDQDRYEREQRRREREYRREQRRRERQARRNNDYYGYGYYGVSAHFRQTALNAGYNEGIKEGRNDRRRGEVFEWRDESDYRDATKDYSSNLGGNRELYRQLFREGFHNGYADGYRGL